MTWVDARHELDELLDGHLAQAAALLVVQQGREVDDDDHEVDAPQLHRYAPHTAFQVWHEGRLVVRSSNAPRLPMTSRQGASVTGFETLEIAGTGWRVFGAHGAASDIQVFVGEQQSARAGIVWAPAARHPVAAAAGAALAGPGRMVGGAARHGAVARAGRAALGARSRRP